MTSKSKITEAYRILSQASGIKVGDTVKVTRTAKTHELGWQNSWEKDMDAFVGKTFVVDRDSDVSGFHLKYTDFNAPFFVLEKVSPPIPTEKKVLIYGAEVRFVYSPMNDDVIVFPCKHEYQFRIRDLKEMVDVAEKFLEQHRNAKKA